jgi:hypothetical protein
MNPNMHTKWEKFRYWRQDFFGIFFDFFGEASIVVFNVAKVLFWITLIGAIYVGAWQVLSGYIGWWAILGLILLTMAIFGALLQ